MNAYIKAICVLSKEGERKEVEFTSGLNIITGESKSGKSALLEIIDYCMGSSRSYIPKGIITNFTEIFVTVFQIGTLNLIVGRKRFEDNGRKQMYVIRTKTFNINDVKLELFTEETMITVDQAKKELEVAFGMEITDMSDNTNKKEGRPSVRNMTSYLFQHQNLIANKFALFYRFDDYYKKEDVIKQFPIFAGWVDQDYYSLLIQLDELEKKKKRNERDQTSYNDAVERLRGRLI
ncbi:ATP-binding protein [Paenibacillus sp. P13VS]|uniref:ATP-binding protein n=1 Tax=Paenibacillus sp. P13VS TaxID=2697367 RepID=UPI00187B5A0E|nr:ATP-binding protein [Paenibacillus sp. P13VS]MBE7682213.1 AAA family ATPase [Paenibacillus sp. P13VS]